MSAPKTIIVHCRCNECDTCNHLVASRDETLTQTSIDEGMHLNFASMKFISLPIEILHTFSSLLPLTCEGCGKEIPISIDINTPTIH